MIDVVGVGAEGFAELPASLQERVLDADVVLGGARHLAMLPFEEGQVREPWPSPLRTALPALLERFDDLDVVALASGDPLVSGIGTTLVALLGADAVRIAPAVSSVALARAAMGWSAESCAVVSVVGRPVELVARELAPGRRIIVLSSDGGTPVELAEMLVRLGFGASELHVLGNLGGADETHQTMTAYRVAGADPSPAERTTTTAKPTTTTAKRTTTTAERTPMTAKPVEAHRHPLDATPLSAALARTLAGLRSPVPSTSSGNVEAPPEPTTTTAEPTTTTAEPVEALRAPSTRSGNEDPLAEPVEAPSFPRLNIVAFEAAGPRSTGWAPGLPDDAYENDGQITKRDVRASALSRLQPTPGEHLWDVGAGSGSIGIEWMRAHPSCRTTAIEGHEERAARIERNAARLGVPGLRVVRGKAPEALAGLYAPDAVFIGGGATVPGVLDCCLEALKPGGRIVVHGVTLETEQCIAAAHRAHGGELTRLSVETSSPIGRFTGWTPARTITQWFWTRP